MANTLVQFRVDETERKKASKICDELGIDLPTYLRICMLRMVKENGIPFSMRLDEISTQRGKYAMQRASQIAKNTGISDMSLAEINKEIAQARKAAKK